VIEDQAIKILPKEIVNKIVMSGNEYGWRLADIPNVIQSCNKLNLALLGGQIRFIFNDATCDLYWLNVDPKEKEPNEDWEDYSKRSCSEFLSLFNLLILKTNFEEEGTNGFNILQEKKESGINILEYMCLIIYPVTDIEYLRLIKSAHHNK